MRAKERRRAGTWARPVVLALSVLLAGPALACAGSSGPEQTDPPPPQDETDEPRPEESMSAEETYRAALDSYRALARIWRERPGAEEARRATGRLREHLEHLAALVEEPAPGPPTATTPARVEPSGPVTPSSEPPTAAEVEAMERATERLRTVLPPREEPGERTLAGVPRDWIGRSSRETLDLLTRLDARLARGETEPHGVETALAELREALDAISRPPADAADPGGSHTP